MNEYPLANKVKELRRVKVKSGEGSPRFLCSRIFLFSAKKDGLFNAIRGESSCEIFRKADYTFSVVKIESDRNWTEHL